MDHLDVDMNTEVFETPDPEVTFQAYAPVGGAHHATRAGFTKHGRVTDCVRRIREQSHSELSEEDVAPAKAFEAFMGKVYKPAATRLPKQIEFEVAGGLPGAAATSSSKRPQKPELEAPLARFTRLTLEVKELEADLTLLAASADDRKARMLVDAAQDAEVDEVMRGLSTLRANLSSIEQNAAFRPFLRHGARDAAAGPADSALALQKELTSRFFQQVEALKAQWPQGATPAARGGSSSTATPAIVYEVFSNGEPNAGEKDASARAMALDARLATLEKAVGNFYVKELRTDGLSALAGGGGADLASMIAALETRVNLLNEKNLDAVKARTTALIHEFTLLNKLKESPGVQSALSAHADREKLQQIYDKLARVDDVAGAVPALVDRLVALKAAHDDALDASARMKKVEQSAETLAALLESDTALLENIEQSLEANVKIFESNMQTLDERMAKVLSSRS
ncbi:hypothetical protein PybrP1_005728 [[Pythium] brassicae (nom. inval.)]|nr:hypothetical protein PybrP1_005728 [[Pythium] brassicae (nom. inval.)]